MRKSILVYVVAALLLAPAAVVRAQGGCVDSPENSTVVFGLLAAIASVAVTRFSNRAGSRRDKSSRAID